MSLVDELKQYGVTGMLDLGRQERDGKRCYVTRVRQSPGLDYEIAVPETVDVSLRAIFDMVVVKTIWNMGGGL